MLLFGSASDSESSSTPHQTRGHCISSWRWHNKLTQTGWRRNLNHGSGGRKSEIQVSADLAPSGGPEEGSRPRPSPSCWWLLPVLGFYTIPSHLCSHLHMVFVPMYLRVCVQVPFFWKENGHRTKTLNLSSRNPAGPHPNVTALEEILFPIGLHSQVLEIRIWTCIFTALNQPMTVT